MTRLKANALSGLVTADLVAGATAFTHPVLARLPVVAAPDYVKIVFDPDRFYGDAEIRHIVAHAAGSQTVTLQADPKETDLGAVVTTSRDHLANRAPPVRWVVSETAASGVVEFVDHYYPSFYDGVGTAYSVAQAVGTGGEFVWNVARRGVVADVQVSIYFGIGPYTLPTNGPLRLGIPSIVQGRTDARYSVLSGAYILGPGNPIPAICVIPPPPRTNVPVFIDALDQQVSWQSVMLSPSGVGGVVNGIRHGLAIWSPGAVVAPWNEFNPGAPVGGERLVLHGQVWLA